ncbi:MAG: hypothetical protein EKK53_26880 [Burkholderiales bacterium]|nr:MAG: hypothetical protein EKK53_26880 [Burkholderiales bacterium]
MSYDLYFKPRTGSLTAERLDAYFRGRPNYQCEGSQAWYRNEDTGVYFVFEFQADPPPDEDHPEASRHCPVALNINCLRPSYFILEAEMEVTAFVAHFDLLVSDPQLGGMGDGEYRADKLVSGWHRGNEFGYGAILGEEKNRAGVSHLPTDQLHQAWRWNLSRAERQARVGASKFVPRIMFVNLGGTTRTAAVWPDGIPVVVPAVDYLCVPRKELAPTRFFRKKEDTTFVAWEQALPVLLRHGTRTDDGAISLNYLEPPSEVVRFVQSFPAESRSVAGVSADQVLDREMYERSLG